jgi:hypothetical protein
MERYKYEERRVIAGREHKKTALCSDIEHRAAREKDYLRTIIPKVAMRAALCSAQIFLSTPFGGWRVNE